MYNCFNKNLKNIKIYYKYVKSDRVVTIHAYILFILEALNYETSNHPETTYFIKNTDDAIYVNKGWSSPPRTGTRTRIRPPTSTTTTALLSGTAPTPSASFLVRTATSTGTISITTTHSSAQKWSSGRSIELVADIWSLVRCLVAFALNLFVMFVTFYVVLK